MHTHGYSGLYPANEWNCRTGRTSTDRSLRSTSCHHRLWNHENVGSTICRQDLVQPSKRQQSCSITMSSRMTVCGQDASRTARPFENRPASAAHDELGTD